MQWLKEHVIASLISAAMLLALLWRSGIVPWVVRIIKALRNTELRTALRDNEALKLTVAQLEADLRQEVRTNLAFSDINKQDRATIRTLVAKIDQHNSTLLKLKDDRLCLVDYSDLFEEIKRSLGL